jgi:hypothetical protein
LALEEDKTVGRKRGEVQLGEKEGSKSMISDPVKEKNRPT